MEISAEIRKATDPIYQKITFYKEYLINRVNGNFSYKKKSYDPNPDLKKYLGIKDGIIVVDYVGTCSKRTELRKF